MSWEVQLCDTNQKYWKKKQFGTFEWFETRKLFLVTMGNNSIGRTC